MKDCVAITRRSPCFYFSRYLSYLPSYLLFSSRYLPWLSTYLPIFLLSLVIYLTFLLSPVTVLIREEKKRKVWRVGSARKSVAGLECKSVVELG